MPILEAYSANGGRELLEEKGVLGELRELPRFWAEYPSQYDYDDRKAALADFGGWRTEVQIDLGPADAGHHERLTPFLDAYHDHWQVAIEHEKKEQMRARWHLLKMQAAAERETTLDIDVAVLMYPTDRDTSLRRTRRELEGPFFNDHFPIEISVCVIEYEAE